MQFPSDYFEDEVRDGFYVPGMMKRAWAAQLEILEDIDKVCKKHNLQYFAEWGTLLGAVRHGGFVPWDDDMDICMKREDYDVFAKIALEELPPWYGMINFEHSDGKEIDCEDFLIRLYSGDRIRMDKPYLDKFHGFPYVSGMDIFPLDYVAPTQKEDEMLCKEVSVLGTLAQEFDTYKPKEKAAYLRQIEETYHFKFNRNKPLKYQIYMLADKLSGSYKEEESKYLTSMVLRTNTDYKIPKEYYAEAIMMPFENTMIPVPIGYDSILKTKYGDYMRPVHDGGAHEYPFYEKQEKSYEKTKKPIFKKYTFSESEWNGDEKRMNNELKTQAQAMVKLLKRMNDNIVNAVGSHDSIQAMRLLEDAQDGAIALGTKIEELKGEGFHTVTLLEQYCEVLYTIHEGIAANENMDVNTIQQMLADNLLQIDESLQKDVILRKEIVFLPYKASMWDSLESVWKVADADPDCDAYVIPIPYYTRNVDGTFGEMHYEGNEYPDYVPITDYQTFNFGLHHPDAIYIHNPYDEYNLTTSVHPFFYSKNIKQFTDRLVYIPYFVLDEIKPTDERAVKGMAHFCTAPGVINADTVIVQSEAMRDIYIQTLTEFAGEKSRPIWEKKILGLGSPKFDKVLNTSDIQVPEEWKTLLYKEDGSKKKVVLYNIGLGALLEHNEAMLDKIENVLHIFQEQRKEITLLWRPHPLIQATIQSMRPQLLERYQKILNQYLQEGWGIYDDTADLDRAIKLSNAYYGDPSSLIQLCKRVEMPIMMQNVDILD
jgi:phosphorylcholine metabolism protein LicD